MSEEEFDFKPASKKQNKLRLGVGGPSGSGKTLAALFIAKGLGGKIGVIDTERGSANLYSDLFPFETLELNPPYSPERFIAALHAAEQRYDVIILDSCTHEWDGSGGCLEINENVAAGKYRGNNWAAWNETTPRHRAFLDAINQSPKHLICTVRSKTETIQGEDKKVKKIGMKVQQRDGFEYEMTLMLEIDHSAHLAVLTKGRLYAAPASVSQRFKEPHVITQEDGKFLLDWLNSGTIPELAPRAKEPEVNKWPKREEEATPDPAKPDELTLGQDACKEYMALVPDQTAVTVRQKFFNGNSLKDAIKADTAKNGFVIMAEEYATAGLSKDKTPALEKYMKKFIPF